MWRSAPRRLTTMADRLRQAGNGPVMAKRGKVLTMDTINPYVKVMEYAVRGPIVARATQLEQELKQGQKKPFKEVIKANIGDAHAMGQHPITFLRQVVALCAYPDLLKSPDFPDDAKARATRVLGGCKGGSSGAYSDSIGVAVVREDVAKYISDRDGYKADPANIFLSNGASEAIRAVLKLMITHDESRKVGIMIPIPQYPLYTATIAEFGAHAIPYYLDEQNKWGLDVNELKRALDAEKHNCVPRALVVINPGNPTGQVLSKQNVEDVLKFAHRENMFLMADEVYQHNVYAQGSSFNSFKKALMDQGPEISGSLELASFMSTSKGFMGECGYRGGYCELMNIDPEVKLQLVKSISAKLCSTVLGQTAMDVVVNPPRPGEPSYDNFIKERDHVLGQLNLKAKMTTEILNSVPGIQCNEVMGAMYAFPRITLPEKAIKAAEAKGQKPDAFYCFELLEETGICVVAGSGFGQKPGTLHFRMTILPQVDKLTSLLDNLKAFHIKFLEKYK